MEPLKLILLVGVIQGFFLFVGLAIKTAGKKKQNYYFLSLVLLLTLALLAKLTFDPSHYHPIPAVWYLPDLVAYAIGPLWYFTLLKSVEPKVRVRKKDVLFLLPVLYQVGFIVFLSFLPEGEHRRLEGSSSIVRLFYVFCATVLVVNGTFLWRAKRLLDWYREARFPELLLRGQRILLLIVLIWLVAFLVSFFVPQAGRLNLRVYNLAFVSLALLVLGMAFVALIRPASFYFLTQTFDGSETFILREIAEKIEAYLLEYQPFLRRKYSLPELATDIGSNPVLTSKAINHVLETNFNDLMNQGRVRHFLRIAREEKRNHLTLWAIAQEAGFGNKVTFYKAFKKETGTTPKLYLAAV